MTDAAIAELSAQGVATTRACAALGRSRAAYYRRHPVCPRPVLHGPPTPRKPQPRALSAQERAEVRRLLHSPRFVDKAPAQMWAELLDEAVYLCSISSMYRALRDTDEVRDRRAQARHPAHVKPELVADQPNRVWSWDITKLHGPGKWTYYYLYVVLDVYSRYVVIVGPSWNRAPQASQAWVVFRRRLYHEVRRKPDRGGGRALERTCPPRKRAVDSGTPNVSGLISTRVYSRAMRHLEWMSQVGSSR